VGSASLALKPGSLLSDKIVIKSINVQGPEITFETDLKANNLSKILANVQEVTGGGGKEPAKPAEPTQAKAGKKLQVDDFLISGAKVHVSVTALGGQAVTIPLPDIHLQDLGKDSDGITPAELTQRVLAAVTDKTIEAAAGAVTDVGKLGAQLTKDAGGAGSNALGTVTKGIGGLFKKK
jgi:uncharacterized protein involved in outer membrane biogenesis